MHCFGVSFHSPDQVIDLLVRAQIVESVEEVLVVRETAVLPSFTKKKVVFIMRTVNFNRRLVSLTNEKYVGKTVFVFESPLRLSEVAGCEPLDFARSGATAMTFSDVKLSVVTLRKLMKRTAEPVRRTKVDHLLSFVDHCKRGSLLNPLMSFIYTLPSSTHQTPVKTACARALRHGVNVQTMLKVLYRESKLSLSAQAANKLAAILQSEPAAKYYAFFKKYRSGLTKTQLEALCIEHGVAVYEVSYILSVLGELAAPKPAKKRRGNK